MRNEGMLFCKKLIFDRGVAKQRKPKLITHHSSLIAPDQGEVH